MVAAEAGRSNARTPIRTIPTFQDPRSEYGTLGQVLLHGDRVAELRVDAEHFSETRAALYRLIRRNADAGQPVDFASLHAQLRRVGLVYVALNALEEWLTTPTGLGELQQRLRERRCRRTIAACGETLVVIACDEQRHVDEVLARAFNVAETLRRMQR